MPEVTVRAPSNIALAKYWGKQPREGNYPAVPSLSMTLDALHTETRVHFSPNFEADRLILDGRDASEPARARVTQLLDRVRRLANTQERAEVVSTNNFPTAAGLASSASGFAALALAACRAAGLDTDLHEVSALARVSSASAARSLFGGYVALDADAESAEQVLDHEQFPLSMLISIISAKPKAMGSTAGMLHTQATSPYYSSWVEHSPKLFEEVRAAVLARDLERLGPAVTQSAMMMHASMWAARPALNYWMPGSLAVLECCAQLRQRGLLAYPTMDAGPNVKVLCSPGSEPSIQSELDAIPSVERTIPCKTGAGPTLLNSEFKLDWSGTRR